MPVNKEIRAAGLKAGLTNKQMDTMPLSAVVEKLPIQIQKDLGLGQFGQDKMKTKKAYGGKIKKKMMGGMVKKKMMAGGGGLKDVPSGNTGLGKLPTPVRNNMGFKASGGKVKKTYAMGGGMRKANYK